ncbi:GlxA family transcriptional regulator [Lysobacter yangpyeongensis]|uniref:GlxA family transcriptional regulator n=1 Tax=Lysobacter yangpyeongensis TaxID=346182 RepID=A0ABW0SMJ7_9GAMM
MKRTVAVTTYDHMNLLDLSGPLQAFATANRLLDAAHRYDVRVVSVQGGAITTGCGLRIDTDAVEVLRDQRIDTLMVPGGCAGTRFEAPAALAHWVAQTAPAVRRVASVCTGAFVLAEAGLLAGRRAATHWHWAEQLGERFPSVHVDADRIFVRDGAIWTSAGVSAGIDLTLALIEEDHGHRVAIETARELVVFVKRAGGQSQFSVPLKAQASSDARFADLHAWMAANLRGDLRVEVLAERAGMSARNFARLYAAHVGRTPAKTVDAMRLEAACRALEETALPLKSVAALAGYADEQALRRAFQRRLGVGPSDYRARFSRHALDERAA